MRAAAMKERPSFPLMKQSDVQTVSHMQMPRWLFSDPRYAGMSLEAKVVYTFLFSRFQLSRRNGWVNDLGEVFVIFPRKELAGALRVCEQRVTAAIRQLANRQLVWEKRCGRGAANQIYLARVQPWQAPEDGGGGFFLPAQEPQDESAQTRPECAPGAAELQAPEPRNPGPSDIDKKEDSHKKVSQSSRDRRTDEGEGELLEILDACELSVFEPETARVFEDAIERLFYSVRFRTGEAVLPQGRVRAKLHRLDCLVLQDVARKLRANLDKEVKNSAAYVMTAIFNGITEYDSDILVDPYLNGMRNEGSDTL